MSRVGILLGLPEGVVMTGAPATSSTEEADAPCNGDCIDSSIALGDLCIQLYTELAWLPPGALRVNNLD